MAGENRPEGIDAIVRISRAGGQRYVPPLSDYENPTPGWTEVEYRCWSANTVSKPTVGYWSGEPGEVSFDSWPYTEICSIVSGSIGLMDSAGKTIKFSGGEGFLIPKGWCGKWLTFEPSEKIFVALE